MFCDLVGSTAMSELMDPEDFRDIISSYQDSCKKHINRYGGYIARYMGDGLLVYFGYPTASERDPERAVRAGLDIVSDVGSQSLPDGTSLHVRVGIATGLVVVGDLIGEGASEERAVLGDTPNLAARLQGFAEPGTVCVSQTTHALLTDVLNFENLGAQSLKGITGAVNVYLAKGEIDTASGTALTQQHTPFVGRQNQLDRLQGLWQNASNGKGQIATLIGEPGFGKSRLIMALRSAIETTAHRTLEIKTSEFHQDSSFRPVRQFMESMLISYDPDFKGNPTQVLENWLSGLPLLADDAFVILHNLLGLPADGAPPHNLDGAALKIRTVETLVDLFIALSADQPLLAIADDAQWLDASTADFLNHLVNRISTSQTLLLIAARPEFAPNWDKSLGITEIKMERLSNEDAKELIAKISEGKNLPDVICQTLLDHSDGIPLYIEELTRSVIEARQSEKRNGDASDISVPTSLQDSLMARLDRLGPTKLIAQKAAVIGRVLDRHLLQAISEDDSSDPERGLLELLISGLIVPRNDISEGVVEFRHALIRDIAYQSLLKRRRKEIHGQVAETLLRLYPNMSETEPEAIAFHFAEADMPEKALSYWKAAGDKATERWANTEAIAHYQNALKSLASANPDDARQEVGLLLDMVGCMRIVDRFEDAFEALERAEALATANGFDRQLIQVYYLLGNLSFPVGDFENCVKSHTRARDLARKSGAAGDEARAESGLGDASLFSGHIKDAEQHYDTCIGIARRENLPAIEIANLPLRGHMRIYLNQFPEAVSDCREAISLATKATNRRAEMVARGSCLAKALIELGEWEEADEQLNKALEIARDLGARRYIPMYLCFGAKVALATGRAKKALELASSAVQLHQNEGFIFSAPMALGTLARIEPDPQQVDLHLAKGQAILEKGSLGQNHFWFRLDAMELGLHRNDAEMVEMHARALETFTAEHPLPWTEFHIRRCRVLSKISRGETSATLTSELKTLFDEANERHQNPAAASLKAALEQA